MPKKFIYLILGLVAIAAAVMLARVLMGGSPVDSDAGKFTAVGTFYPLSHFAAQVGGGLVTVVNITPAGAEPHDYEPTSQDIQAIYGAKVFLVNGGGLDAWA